jgi:trk system potassium uptake protein TrkA
MTTIEKTYIIIVGCGRLGSELALSLWQKGHNVTVLDANPHAFERLGMSYQGRTVQGDGLDQEALKRAGIGEAHALAAVTTSDSVNIVVARVAQDIFNVKHVVARVYNPRREPVYQKLGLTTIASSSWAAQRMEQIILHPGLRSLHATGDGEVQVYEISVPKAWDGLKVGELIPPGEAALVALARGNHTSLPTPETILHAHDLLQVSATTAGADLLRQRLNANGE